MELFLNFISECSLLVYRNTIDFCLLISHPEILLTSLISSNSLLVFVCIYFLVCSVCKIVSFANRDNFTDSFPI